MSATAMRPSLPFATATGRTKSLVSSGSLPTRNAFTFDPEPFCLARPVRDCTYVSFARAGWYGHCSGVSGRAVRSVHRGGPQAASTRTMAHQGAIIPARAMAFALMLLPARFDAPTSEEVPADRKVVVLMDTTGVDTDRPRR